MTFTTHTLIFHTTVRDIIQDNFPGHQHRDGGGGGGGERVGRVMSALSALSVKYIFLPFKKTLLQQCYSTLCTENTIVLPCKHFLPLSQSFVSDKKKIYSGRAESCSWNMHCGCGTLILRRTRPEMGENIYLVGFFFFAESCRWKMHCGCGTLTLRRTRLKMGWRSTPISASLS